MSEDQSRKHYQRFLNIEFDWDPDHLSYQPPVEGPPIQITIDMVKKAISQMKAGKAPGPLGIVVEMIRATGDMDLDFPLWSAIQGACSSLEPCTSVVRVLCQELEPTAFLVHPVIFIFPAFTLSPFFSIASFQVKSLLIHSSSDSAMLTRSSA